MIKQQLKSFIKNTKFLIKETLKEDKVQRKAILNNCKNPILLIYGFSLSRRAMSILERRLRKDGFQVISFNIGSIKNIYKTGDIPYRAKLIKDKLENLYAKYPTMGRISIIAHSEGGLIARYYLQYLNGHKQTETLITLATPHNGSWVAYIGTIMGFGIIAKDIYQMIPNSKFIKEINKSYFPTITNLYSLYSNSDLICPPNSCIIKQNTNNIKNIEINNICHNDFLFKKSVYNLIKQILKE